MNQHQFNLAVTFNLFNLVLALMMLYFDVFSQHMSLFTRKSLQVSISVWVTLTILKSVEISIDKNRFKVNWSIPNGNCFRYDLETSQKDSKCNLNKNCSSP